MTAIYRVDFPATALGVELGPSRYDEVVGRDDVFAAIPAPPFGPNGPELLLRDLGRQVQVASRQPSSGIVFCVDSSGTTARRGGNPTRGCAAAVQASAVLVEAGAIVAPDGDDYTSRTAIVLRRDGGLTFAATRSATSREFAREIIDSTDGSWAAATATGDHSVLATRQGVLLGDPAAVASAWLVARRPGVSPTRLTSLTPVAEMVPASRAVPGLALPGLAYAPQSQSQTLLRVPSVDRSDLLPVAVGVTLLAAAAAWWYYDDRST